ncbi:MAG: methionyl-tRNA formyltransferase [Roseimicrobium sp.]
MPHAPRSLRIVFLGTGDIGLPSLDALLSHSEHQVAAVITQPDKPVGRKMVLTPPQVEVRALAGGVPVLQPERIKHAVETLQALEADVFVVVAYGQLLPRTVLDIPKLACLNIHASLLPRHRGASPIQAAIRDGDAASGITVMWMNEGLDTGDVLLMDTLPIEPSDTGGTLHDKLAALAPTSLARALAHLAAGTAPRVPQHEALATHCRKLEREHGHLHWSQSAPELERCIRAYSPWPGTYCLLPMADGKTLQLKIHQARIAEGAAACPTGGTVIAAHDSLLISCGSGVLELQEVQLEGKKRMSAAQFLRGHKLEVGTQLG